MVFLPPFLAGESRLRDRLQLRLCLKKEAAQLGLRSWAGTSKIRVTTAPTPCRESWQWWPCWLRSTGLRPWLGPEIAWCFHVEAVGLGPQSSRCAAQRGLAGRPEHSCCGHGSCAWWPRAGSNLRRPGVQWEADLGALGRHVQVDTHTHSLVRHLLHWAAPCLGQGGWPQRVHPAVRQWPLAGPPLQWARWAPGTSLLTLLG